MSKQEITPQEREKAIVRVSAVGIAANIVLVIFKAMIGLAANSIAIVLDAVNNLTDALSSVITIIGAKIAGRKPDKKHPLGHGRFEYMSQLIVAAIVLYAGITSLVESVKKIIHPEEADYSTVSLIIVASAVLVKILLGLFVQRKGKQVKSGSLVASGKDALFDAILSASVLLSAIVFLTTGLSLEAWVGAVIAVFIIKSGIELVREAINLMVGIRPDSEISRGIKATIANEPEVRGVYDLVLNDYGPDKCLASAHVEVNDTLTARDIDALTRRVQQSVFTEHNVILVALGVYAYNTRDDFAAKVRSRVTEIVMGHEGVIQMHGFYLDENTKTITFDVVIAFETEDRSGLYDHICDEIQKEYPDYKVFLARDDDLSD